LFVNGYKGAEARNDARVGNLAKHEWILVYAIDGDATMMSESLLKDINKALRDKHDCGTVTQNKMRPNEMRGWRGGSEGQVD